MSEISKILKEDKKELNSQSTMSILNKNNKIFTTRLLEKEIRKKNRYERLTNRPEAPHNTTQYLTHKRKVKDIQYCEMDFDWQKGYTIDNFIITGGSMKGIIHHIMLFN